MGELPWGHRGGAAPGGLAAMAAAQAAAPTGGGGNGISDQLLKLLRRNIGPIVGLVVCLAVFAAAVGVTKGGRFYDPRHQAVPYWEVVIVLLGLVLMIYFMVLEIPGVPAFVVMIFGSTIWSLLGIIPSQNVLAGLSNGTVTNVGLLFVAAKIVVNTGVLDICIGVLLGHPASSKVALARIHVVVGLLSAIVNNTPMIAMMRPILKNWCLRTGFSTREFAMPMAFASQLGGSLTMMGSPTNFAAQSAFGKLGYDFGFFELTLPAFVLFFVGLIYALILSTRCLGQGIAQSDETPDVVVYENTFQIAFKVDAYGAFAGGELSLVSAGCSKYPGVNGVAMVTRDLEKVIYASAMYRHDESLNDPSVKLQGGDVVIFEATAEGIVALRSTRGLTMATEEEAAQLGHGHKQRCVFEIEVPPTSGLLGRVIHASELRAEHHCAFLAVRGRPFARTQETSALRAQVSRPWSRQQSPLLGKGNTKDSLGQVPESAQCAANEETRSTRAVSDVEVCWVGNHSFISADPPAHMTQRSGSFAPVLVQEEKPTRPGPSGRWSVSHGHLPDAATVAVRSFDGFNLCEGDVLLVEADAREIGSEAWARDFGIIRAIPNSTPPPPRTDDVTKKVITTSILTGITVTVGLFVGSSFTNILEHFTLTNNLLVFLSVIVATGALPVQEGLRTMDVGVLLTIVGAFPLGDGLAAVGLDTWSANALVAAASPMGTYAVMVAIYLVCCALSNLISNIAVIAIVAPIAIQVAEMQGQSLRSMVLVSVLGTSAVFTCPIGHQTNLMVVPLGNYTWGDFFKFGAPYQLVHMLVCCWICQWM